VLGAGGQERSTESNGEKLASSDDVGSREHFVSWLVGWLVEKGKCCKWGW
jgi:hypothetical protein